MPSAQVVVVVVAWNGLEDLPQCLAHLTANTHYQPCRFVVIDNASTDGSRQWLSGAAGIELIASERNLGWVGGVNLALQQYNPDYFFFLNQDAFVEPGWLEPLVEALEREPRAGFASPKFLYPDGRIHYGGAYISRSGGIRVFGHGDPDGPPHDRARETPFAHGQCLVRATMTREIGLLDEGFGLGYFEEVDYQLRARRRGWSILYVPTSVIVHATSRSFDKHPGGFKEQLLVQNWLRVLALHWPLSSLVWRLPFELLRPARAIRAGTEVLPTLRAWKNWFLTLPEIRSRRAAINRDGTTVDFTTLRDPL